MSAGLGAPSLLGDLSPELIARLLQARPDQAGPGSPDALLFDRGGMGGGANAFSGTSGTIEEPRPPAQSRGVLAGVLPSPQATGSLSKPPAAADSEDRAPPSPNAPGARAVPQPPARPAEFSEPAGIKPVDSFDPLTGQPVSGSPKPLVQPAAPPGASGGVLGGLFGGGNNDPWLSNTLLGLGAGILSGKTFGEGLGRGFDNAQRYNALQAQTDLASAKAKREQAALGGNASILKRAYPQLSDAELAAMAGNSGNVTTALQILRDPTHGMPKTPEQMQTEAAAQARGSMEGGAKPVERIQAEAQAQAAGAAAGKPAEAYNLSAGQTRYDGETNQQIAAAAPDKPQNFDTESKLRGEFAKGLGTFQDVHDGYGRVIAATKQREANPNGVSPASDISLIFGYMKMLDPGSVVREGEYATAKNAAGIPVQIQNAYNKALSGEFLSPDQRQDFLGQAAQLYGTARKNAEAVAGRYRNLAGQYGVDPDRTAYLPDMPIAPTVGRDRMKPGAAPSGEQRMPAAPSRADLEAEARRRRLIP